MKETVIDFSCVTKLFHAGPVETHALEDITLSVATGEFIAITGASGCGKSTLLSILGLLDTPTHGTYKLMGLDVGQLSPTARARLRNRKIGFVFQSFNLVPKLNALENVALPLEFRGAPLRERRQRGLNALQAVGMSHRARHFPEQLSGGQQQRVAIARAIVTEPALLLADEPTGNLDTHSGAEVMELLRSLNLQGKTVLTVTHDQNIAATASRRICMKDGRILYGFGTNRC